MLMESHRVVGEQMGQDPVKEESANQRIPYKKTIVWISDVMNHRGSKEVRIHKSRRRLRMYSLL